MISQKYFTPFLLLLAMTVLFTGCGIPSVHPLYEPEDLIMQENLTGQWKSASGNTIYQVYSIQEMIDSQTLRDSLGIKDEDDELLTDFSDKGLEKLYMVFDGDIEEEDTSIYLAGLLKIGNNHYFDFYKYHHALGRSEFLFPVHLFIKVDIEDDTLVMHQFREEWIKELIKNQQIRIKHEESFDNFLLTASPKELKGFIEKYGDDPKAYRSDTDSYIKINADE